MFSYFADALNVKSIGEILAPTLTPEAQLHAAIEDGLMDKVRHLIEQDQVDPNARNTVGSLPIHTAAYHGQIAIVEYLVHEHQVDLKVPGPRGNTTLHLAASRGHFELVQLLIKSGAHPATQNESKRTAYDVAKGDSLRQYLLPLVFQHEDPSLKAANLPPGITPTADPNAVKAPLAPPPTTMSNGSVYAPAAVLLPNRSMVTSNSRGSKSDPKIFRPIQADGFGSSVGNEQLTAFYGNTREVKQTPPPPSLGTSESTSASTTATATGAGPPQPSYSAGVNPYAQGRYTTYDVNSNTGQALGGGVTAAPAVPASFKPAPPKFTIFNPTQAPVAAPNVVNATGPTAVAQGLSTINLGSNKSGEEEDEGEPIDMSATASALQ